MPVAVRTMFWLVATLAVVAMLWLTLLSGKDSSTVTSGGAGATSGASGSFGGAIGAAQGAVQQQARDAQRAAQSGTGAP